MQKLKNSEIPVLREQLLKEQNGLCALCLEPIESGKAVLDHDHKSGKIRAVLHRGCNALEGQITNSLPRNLITESRLRNILARLLEYQKTLRPELHPSHKTPEERKEHARQKRIKNTRKARK